MNLPSKAFTGNRTLVASFLILAIIAVSGYLWFLNKARQIEAYDDINYHLSSIRVSITKLEYLLDMFVVAGRFEDTTVALIKSDVERLDKSISEVTGGPKYAGIIKGDGIMAEGMASISNDWRTIKKEIASLNEAMTTDEAMLIHNSVDTNTILVNEIVDRLLGVTADKRKDVSTEAKMVVLNGILGFLLLLLVSAFLIYKNVISPVRKASYTARRISSGDTEARFRDGVFNGIAPLSAELNRMLDAIAALGEETNRRDEELAGEIGTKVAQISAINSLTSLAALSPAQNEMFSAAIGAALSSGGADAAAVYMIEEGALRLKASAGFDDDFVSHGALIPLTGIKGADALASSGCFNRLDDYPSRGYSSLLRERGFGSLAAVPIRFGGGTAGFLYAAFKAEAACGTNMPFFEVIAAEIGSYAGYSGLFHKEHSRKRFFERVVNQLPFGLAVFDKSGACLMANSVLKRYVGPASDFDMAGGYNLFEDNVMDSEGIAAALRKSCEGFVTESVISYSPSSVVKFKFNGAPRSMRVRTFPLFDAGGEISSIALIYEDLAEAAGAVKKGSA